MATCIKSPDSLERALGSRSVFLAGSIEMGRAEPWQARLERELADLDILILNPRRDDWDETWSQTIEDAQFRQQVEWELTAQERASWIAMYFAPQTRSPITLLEFGLFARSGKLLVCCPEGFWRKGNIEVVCTRYQIPLLAELDELIAVLRQRLNERA